jgi:hypothetical protein
MVTFVPGVYSHPRPAGLSAAIHLSFIISEMPQDYENYFRLSLGKTAFKDTTREPSFQQELTAACRCSSGMESTRLQPCVAGIFFFEFLASAPGEGNGVVSHSTCLVF